MSTVSLLHSQPSTIHYSPSLCCVIDRSLIITGNLARNIVSSHPIMSSTRIRFRKILERGKNHHPWPTSSVAVESHPEAQ